MYYIQYIFRIPYSYVQNIKGCKFIDVTNPVFLWCYFQELQNAHQNFHGFCVYSLLCVVAHVTCVVHYFKRCWTKHLCLMCQNCRRMQSAIVAVQRMNGKVCLPQWGNGHFQVSNATVHAYLVLQLLQTNLLPMKFGKLKLCGWPIDYENNKNHIPQKFAHVYLRLWKPHNICR